MSWASDNREPAQRMMAAMDDNIAYRIAQHIRVEVQNWVAGDSRKTLPQIVFEAIEAYDKERIEEARVLREQVYELTALLPPKPMVWTKDGPKV